jgi:hypothetical protein
MITSNGQQLGHCDEDFQLLEFLLEFALQPGEIP